MFEDIYREKVVLVTGHTGFKGTWLSIWLMRLGAHVVGYSLEPPTTPSLFETSGLANLLRDVRGDVRDTGKLAQVIKDSSPEFIFHLAAMPLVLESYAKPIETFDINVMGTLSLLQAIRDAGRSCCVVCVSTDKCYLNREWEYGYRETDPLGGCDPYSASKAAMEIAVSSFRESFFPPSGVSRHGVRLASARAGNVLGGGDWAPNRIVPDAIRAFHAGRELVVRAPGAIRPWQHALEPISGYLLLGNCLSGMGGERFAGGWNFGPLQSSVFNVADLASALSRIWGSGSWRAEVTTDSPHEAGSLRLCIDKATADLAWQPVWDIEETVLRTVQWYSAYLRQPERLTLAFDLCLEDIAAYETSASRKGVKWAVERADPVGHSLPATA